MKREIEDFVAPVLARYIRQRVFLRDIVADLTKLEAQVEYEQIQSEIERITYKKRIPFSGDDRETLVKQLKAGLAESKKLDQLWKRSDELMSVMFPAHAELNERIKRESDKPEEER